MQSDFCKLSLSGNHGHATKGEIVINEAIFHTGIWARLTPTSVIGAEEIPTMPPYIRMSKQPDAATLRRWAVRCRSKGESRYISGEERELLFKVYSSLLELAVTQDWLNGKREDRADIGVRATVMAPDID